MSGVTTFSTYESMLGDFESLAEDSNPIRSCGNLGVVEYRWTYCPNNFKVKIKEPTIQMISIFFLVE